MDRLLIKLERVILPELGRTNAYRIIPFRVDQYKVKRLKAGVTRTTVHGEITYIHAILNWALQERHITRNPLAGYKKPKRDDAIISPPTQQETERILAVAPSHIARALALSYFTGIRPGHSELLGLTWNDIDWELRIILVRSARKGGPRARMVPIHRDFFDVLGAWHRADGHNGYIIQWQGKPVKRIIKGYNSAKKKAGITRRLPPYSFRHAFATKVLGQGADLKATSEILGHSRPDTTMRIYQHTDLTLLRESVNKLPALNFGFQTNTPGTTNDVPKNNKN